MKIKLLQLNINSDNYWDTLVSYLTSHDFDILQFQEVTGKDTICYTSINSKRDGFEELTRLFHDKYKGELAIAQRYTSSPHSYMGNATFYRKDFSLIKRQEVTLFHEQEYFPSDYKTGETSGRNLLHLTLEVEKKQISFLTTHFAWGWDHIEKPHQTRQGEIIINYLQTVAAPFIFSGDFNLTPEQPVIQKLDKLARNLTAENKITNTLNPKNHRAKILFPKGLAVDYIFISKDLQVKNFAVVDEGLSDHFGLTVEIEI
jgi:endonuclease/exonuclease/phosphatase family metal-dependent hydrolase